MLAANARARRTHTDTSDLVVSDFVVGTVARLDATKDTITLARAFARLPRHAGIKLLIVGDGNERNAELARNCCKQRLSIYTPL